MVITGRLIPGAFDAVELIRRIKAAHPTKPVIAVTACGAGAMRDAANRAGCALVLTKPCLAEDVLAEVRRLLGQPTE